MLVLQRTRRDWLLILAVAPVAVWLPVALLLMVGTQAAHSKQQAQLAAVGVAGVTLALVLLPVVAAAKLGVIRPSGHARWIAAGLIATVLLAPVGLIVYLAVRALLR